MGEVMEKIGDFLDQSGIFSYGTAFSTPLEDEPTGHRPSDLLPGARSVMCLGLPVPKGVFQCGVRSEPSYWRTANVTYRYLDAVLVRCAALLEQAGASAVPVFACFPYVVRGKGDLYGYCNLVRMAELSGLGKRGKNGLLISARAGSRLLLGGIVTTASLPQVRPHGEEEAGCPGHCHACREACPVQAIDSDGRVDRLKCTRHSMRSPLFSHLMKSGEVKESDLELVNHVAAVDDHSMYTCVACVAACPL